MDTLRLFTSPEAFTQEPSKAGADLILRAAAALIRNGGTVAFATETVYGLGANALDADAVAKIFIAKQRPAWDPLIVHIADEAMLAQVAASVPQAAQVLMTNFWAGPLTLLLPRHPNLPASVTAGRASVGVRMPAHPVAMALIRAAGVPIAAPSANTFGHVSPTTAAHVAADLDGRIDAILDSGETTYGLESTVVDTCVQPCIVYRPGAVTLEQLRAVWPAIQAYAEKPAAGARNPAALPSPGLGMRHYAPRAQLVLVEGDPPLAQRLLATLREMRGRHPRTGLMLADGIGSEELLTVTATSVFLWGDWRDPAQLAHRLFAGLRALDDQHVQVIVCPVPAAEGLGAAIIDRLRKAARQA